MGVSVTIAIISAIAVDRLERQHASFPATHVSCLGRGGLFLKAMSFSGSWGMGRRMRIAKATNSVWLTFSDLH